MGQNTLKPKVFLARER